MAALKVEFSKSALMSVSITNDKAILIYHLRRLLPLAAHGRRGLMARLKRERPEINSRSRVYVTNVYDGGRQA